VVAFLFWVYLSANILLFGAEVVSELPDVMAGHFDERKVEGARVTNREKVTRFLRSLVMRPKQTDNGTAPGEPSPPPTEQRR
jgi:hypothetical protein